MQLRPGVYRFGETVSISGKFFQSDGQPMTADNILITFRKPPPDNSVYGPFPVGLVDGEIYFEIDPDLVGTWKVRLECQHPKSAVTESKFEVVHKI